MRPQRIFEEQLSQLKDEKNALFCAKLTPGIDPERFLGARMPELRALAKDLMKHSKTEVDAFLQDLPHYYYDENMLHGLLITNTKEYDRVIQLLDAFLPYVDNWAVCDTMRPAPFKKKGNCPGLTEKIADWVASSETYTCRFGISMLMTFYLDEDFSPEYPELVAAVRSDEYYVNMMIAWYFATALAKQWDAVIGYLTGQRISVWTHNKTIQKAIESYRITPEQKEYLRTLKIRTR